MEYDNVVYTMILILIGINVMMVYLENFWTDENGIPVLTGYKAETGFGYNDINTSLKTIENNNSINQASVSGNLLATLAAYIQSGLSAFTQLLNTVLNLSTGWARFLYYITAPLGHAGQGQHMQVGDGITMIFGAVFGVIILLGIVQIFRWIVQVISFVRFGG